MYKGMKWYQDKKLRVIYAGLILFGLAVACGYFGWIDYEALRPYFTW